MSFKFEKLEVWKSSKKFISEIYLLTNKFPREELFGLTSQIRRAAISIALNIAEGSSRRSDPEFTRFLNIARASLNEVVTGLFIAKDLNFITKQEEFDYFYNLCDNLAARLGALSKSIKKP